jgi:hypothetical protein
VLGLPGCSESSSFSRGFGSGRAGLWRGLAVWPGADPVPDSGGEEPPILGLTGAVIQVRLAALSGSDSGVDSQPVSVVIPAR